VNRRSKAVIPPIKGRLPAREAFGSVEMMHWALSENPDLMNDPRSCEAAVESGNLEVLKEARGERLPVGREHVQGSG
jgi:hypothetical protein